MTFTEALSPSLEDYLEAIFHIMARKGAAKAKDIARRMKVNNSSVTGALKALSEKGLVNYVPYDLITLTSSGEEVARGIVKRHNALRDFFEKVLVVEPGEADKVACKMEHYLPQNVLERFIRFTEFVETCPRGGHKWISGFSHYCETENYENCEECIKKCLEAFKKKEKERIQNKGMRHSLADLDTGQKGRIKEIRAKGALGKRLQEMGATKGAVVEVEKVAPLGDPIDIKIRGYHLSLRKGDAIDIQVEILC